MKIAALKFATQKSAALKFATQKSAALKFVAPKYHRHVASQRDAAWLNTTPRRPNAMTRAAALVYHTCVRFENSHKRRMRSAVLGRN